MYLEYHQSGWFFQKDRDVVSQMWILKLEKRLLPLLYIFINSIVHANISVQGLIFGISHVTS